MSMIIFAVVESFKTELIANPAGNIAAVKGNTPGNHIIAGNIFTDSLTIFLYAVKRITPASYIAKSGQFIY